MGQFFVSIFNENTALEYELATNDNIIGILYSSLADAFSFSYGVKSLRNKERTIEAIIHPCRYDDGTIDNRFTEYLVTKNKKFQQKKQYFEIYVCKKSCLQKKSVILLTEKRDKISTGPCEYPVYKLCITQ